MIKIYGVHGSPFVRKVLVALDFKGIPYEIVPQMPFSGDKEYLKINPLGKVPTLVLTRLKQLLPPLLGEAIEIEIRPGNCKHHQQQ